MVDGYLSKLYDLGCEISFTAGHGTEKEKLMKMDRVNLIYVAR